MAAPAARAQASASFVDKVVGAATQGAAGAVVGATLSAVTEPVVNRILVQRMGLLESVRLIKPEAVASFFNTTIVTNFIKFPFFEVVNMLLGDVDLPPTARGAVLGAVFTTLTLPITNYRYMKSMGLPVDFGGLYKAYLPTVLRDIVYGIVRNLATQEILRSNPDITKTAGGRFALMFVAVMASCVISAPGNEVRGYYLQPADRRLPVNEFFKPARFIRSTAVGPLSCPPPWASARSQRGLRKSSSRRSASTPTSTPSSRRSSGSSCCNSSSSPAGTRSSSPRWRRRRPGRRRRAASRGISRERQGGGV